MFRWTRHGQVAQAKTVSPVWTTPAALLTKNRFRRANFIYGCLDDYLRVPLADAAHAAGKSANQQWVSSTYKVLQGKPWYYPDTYRSTYHLQIQEHTDDGERVTLTLGPPLDPELADARLGPIAQDEPDGTFNWMMYMLIDELPHGIIINPWDRPVTLVLFPRFKDTPAAIGHSVGIHIPVL